MTHLAARWWPAVVLPMAAMLVAAFFNVAFLYAAFMWVLVLVPPGLMVAYYSYLLTPVASRLSRPHFVEFMPDGVAIRFVASGEEDAPVVEDIYLERGKLQAVGQKATFLELIYRGTEPRLVIVPWRAFADADAATALDILYMQPGAE